MKWIGQHIYDLIARFRSDVYFENLSETEETRGLVVDADGKVSINPATGEEYATHIYERVRNDEGSTIPVGTPVYSKGEIGGSERIKVGIADASDPTKMPAIGITDTELTTTGSTKDGRITLVGVYNTNISGFTGLSENDIVYVAIGGGLTITKPTGVNLIQNVGIILKTNGNTIQGLQVACIGRTNDVPTPLYIDHANQRLGIGATSPSTKLHIEDSSHVYSTLQSTGANTEVAHKYRSSTLTSGYYWWTGLNNYDKYQIAYGTSFDNAGTALCIDTSGNVGIGTTSPSYPLHIATDSSLHAAYIKNTNNNGGGLVVAAANGGGGTNTILSLRDKNDNSKVSVIENGNVGIGTTSPNALLDVDNRIYLQNDGTVKWGASANAGHLTWDTNQAIVKGLSGQALLLGSNNTSARMTIDTSGNVGIGTTSPSKELHIKSYAPRLLIEGTGASAENEEISRVSGLWDGTYVADIQFLAGDDTANKDNGKIAFRTYTSDGAVGTRMLIDEVGNVGIGTTSPASKLHINGTGSPSIIIQDSDGTDQYATINHNNGANQYIARNNTSNGQHVWFGQTGVSSFTERMRIDASGNVGIGTTSPGRKLEVDFTGSVTGAKFTRSDAAGSSLVEFANSAGVKSIIGYDAGLDGYKIGTSSATNLFVKQSGNVGIGTTSPTHKLEVRGGDVHFENASSSNTFLDVKGSSANGYIRAYSDSNSVWLYQGGSNSYLQAQSGSTLRLGSGTANVVITDTSGEVMRTSSGNVGIGTTSPARKLSIQGDNNTALSITSPNTNYVQLALGDTDDDNYGQIILDNSTNKLQIQNGGGSTVSDRGITLDSSENVGIGTASPSEKLEVSGKILATGGQIRAGSYLESYPSFSFADDIDTGMFSDTANQLEFVTGGSSRVTINSSGNVGVGTTSPGYRFVVNSYSADTVAKFESTDSIARLELKDNNDAAYVGTQNNKAFIGMEANATGTNNLIVTSDGKVGIGTTSPSEKLEVNGNISLTGSVQKQIQVFPMNFVDDLGTDKHFMPFVTNVEQTVVYQEEAAMVMPADGRVVSVTVHYAQMDGTDGNITVGIETSACGQSYANPWTVEETETISASVADDHHVFHFAFDNAKHFESTDKMAISIQQSTDMQSAARFFWVTAVIEYDWSTFLGGTSAEYTTTP